MNCEKFVALLPQYPDQMPDSETLQAFLAHAAECPGCAALLAEQEALLASLQTLDDELEIPAAFSQGWRKAVREDAKPKRRMIPWQRITAVAAAFALVLFGGTALMRGGYILHGIEDTAPTAAFQSEPVIYASAMPTEAGLNGMAYDEMLPAGTSAPLPAGGMAVSSKMEMAEADMPAARQMEPMEAAVLGDMAMEAEEEADMATETEADFGMTGSAASSPGAVLLRSASISLDTDAFDEDLDTILASVKDTGGWIAYQSVWGASSQDSAQGGRTAWLEARVPVEALDAFAATVSAIGQVTSTELVAEDISAAYYDVEARLDMYTAQRARLQALLDTAKDVSDIIEIEERLSEVQYHIDSLSGNLAHWDSLSQDATVTITLQEVASTAKEDEMSIGQRIAGGANIVFEAVRGFLADLVVFTAIAAPYLLGVAAIALLIWALAAYGKRKQNNKKGDQ